MPAAPGDPLPAAGTVRILPGCDASRNFLVRRSDHGSNQPRLHHVVCPDRACRRPAAAAAQPGGPDHCARHHHGRGRQRHRQRGAADDRGRSEREPGLLDLDRQRVPARDHDFAAAAGFAGRDRRLSPRLPRWAGAVHACIRVLRAGAYVAAADDRAHRAGVRRGRDHERQRGAGALHLSAPPARPRHRAQRARRRFLGRSRPDDRGRHSRGWKLALAIRHQRAARRGDAGARLAQPAPHQARGPFLRLAERGSLGDHVRRRYRRDRQRRSWRGARHLPGPVRNRRRRRPAVGLPRNPHGLAASAGRSVAHPCLRAVDCDLDRFVLRPDAGLRRDPLLPAEPVWLFGGAYGPLDHAMADRSGLRSPPRRPPGRALSGRPARRHRADAVCLRPRRARLPARSADTARYHLADGAGRCRLRPVPDAEQPHHDRSRAA